MTFAERLLARYQRMGWTEGLPGEWGHINGHTRQVLRMLLDAGDVEQLDNYFAHFFRTELSLGITSFDYREVIEHPQARERFAIAAGGNYELWRLYTGETDPAILAAPDVGAPVACQWQGTTFLFDTPRHDHYAKVVADLLPQGGAVLEIGGGYGGSAHQLLKRRPDARVILCDLPETLYIAWYWLERAGHTVAWASEGDAAQVVLLPAQWMPQANPPAQILFSAHALGEMDAETARGYMAWAQDRGVRWIYHDSPAIRMDDPNLTAVEYPELMARDLEPDPALYRQVYRAPALWPNTGNRYVEFLYERR